MLLDVSVAFRLVPNKFVRQEAFRKYLRVLA